MSTLWHMPTKSELEKPITRYTVTNKEWINIQSKKYLTPLTVKKKFKLWKPSKGDMIAYVKVVIPSLIVMIYGFLLIIW